MSFETIEPYLLLAKAMSMTHVLDGRLASALHHMVWIQCGRPEGQNSIVFDLPPDPIMPAGLSKGMRPVAVKTLLFHDGKDGFRVLARGADSDPWTTLIAPSADQVASYVFLRMYQGDIDACLASFKAKSRLLVFEYVEHELSLAGVEDCDEAN